MNALLRFLGLEPGHDVRGITGYEWQVSHPLEPVLLWLLVGLGLLLALVNFLPRIAMRPRNRVASFLLRLAMLGVLLVVLAGVELEADVVTNEKQQWVILLDDSGSMATKDVGDRTRFAVARQDLERIRDEAGGSVQVSVQTGSGRAVGEEPGVGPTLLGEALARAALSRARPDRVIILTDGRDSEGRDLRALGEDIAARDV